MFCCHTSSWGFALVATHGLCPPTECITMLGKGVASTVPCTGCTCLVPCASAAPCLCLLLGQPAAAS